MHFSSHTLPELHGLNFAQRMQVIRKAADQIPTPKKLVLNLVKLVLLVPMFLLLSQFNQPIDLLPVLLLLLAYPLLTRPLTFFFCQPFLENSRRQLNLAASADPLC